MSERWRNIRIDIGYDGTDFSGWQVQHNARTVQGTVERALEKIHKQRILLHGAGRTDTGVHAVGQVANFYTDISSMPVEKFTPAMNRLLPRDVTVLASREVPIDFHARFNATRRTYRYYLYPSRSCPPSQARFCFPIGRDVSLQSLNELAVVIIGEHDFASFATEMEQEKSTIRTVFHSYFFVQGTCIVYHISGSGFLRKMVRSIIGTMLDLERRGAGAQELHRIVQSRSRSKAGETAPAKGLFLYRVEYDYERTAAKILEPATSYRGLSSIWI